MNDKTVIRRLQFTDLKNNNNKFWMVEWDPDTQQTKISWGRVGDAGQSQTKILNEQELRRKIAEKIAKGYREVDLYRPTIAPTPSGNSPVDPKVDQLLNWIFTAAGEYIASYLAGTINELSAAQLDKGRDLLHKIANYRGSVSWLVQEYYRTIPTQLPRKIDPDELVQKFNVKEQETRLDQLEAALSTITVPGQVPNHYTALGAEIKLLPQSHRLYDQVYQYAMKTLKSQGKRILDIFTVKIPHERQRYELEGFGAFNIMNLWHGTRNPNVRHILKQGLRLPRSAANGWRFGPGIYLSDSAWRSWWYTKSRGSEPRMMFLCDTKVGTPWKSSGRDSSMKAPKRGYHSTWGTGAWGNRGDEIVVYRESQVTIRAILTMD